MKTSIITRWHSGALKKGLPWFVRKQYQDVDFDNLTFNSLTPKTRIRILQHESKRASLDETSKFNVDSIHNLFNRSQKQRMISKHTSDSFLKDESRTVLEWLDDILSYSLHIVDDGLRIDYDEDVVG